MVITGLHVTFLLRYAQTSPTTTQTSNQSPIYQSPHTPLLTSTNISPTPPTPPTPRVPARAHTFTYISCPCTRPHIYLHAPTHPLARAHTSTYISCPCTRPHIHLHAPTHPLTFHFPRFCVCVCVCECVCVCLLLPPSPLHSPSCHPYSHPYSPPLLHTHHPPPFSSTNNLAVAHVMSFAVWFAFL